MVVAMTEREKILLEALKKLSEWAEGADDSLWQEFHISGHDWQEPEALVAAKSLIAEMEK